MMKNAEKLQMQSQGFDAAFQTHFFSSEIQILIS